MSTDTPTRPGIRRVLIGAAVAIALMLPAVVVAGSDRDATNAVRRALDGGRARNVIMFLGDGMGDSEITIARYYAKGAGNEFAGIDALPFTGESTTWSIQESAPTLPEYVPDSAATGTAWATGHKTSNGRISTTAGTDLDLKTILERAQKAGLRTGNVSTAEITDATPAVLDSHVSARGCQGPADMGACPSDLKSAGGGGSIAEQTVDHHVDVVLGGGKNRFDQVIPTTQPNGGKTVLQTAVAQGYQVVTDRAGLLAASGGKKLLGLFNGGNMTTEWNGALASPYPGTGPQRCTETNRPANEPTLAEMTTKAISLLDPSSSGQRSRDARRGFFLQVEGASIDKQDHAQNPCAQIGETVAFDKAIQVGLQYAKHHPDTLIIVTADHAHTSQIIDPQTATDHSPGAISTLITVDGVEMVVNYATNLNGRSQTHTGSEVRVAAQGPQAANVLGIVDETDLYDIMARALGLD